MQFKFKEEHTFDKRLEESTKIRQKYPSVYRLLSKKFHGLKSTTSISESFLYRRIFQLRSSCGSFESASPCLLKRRSFCLSIKRYHNPASAWVSCTRSTRIPMVSYTLPTAARTLLAATELDTRLNFELGELRLPSYAANYHFIYLLFC